LSDLFLSVLITSNKRAFGSFCQIHFLFHYFITLQNRKFGIYLILSSTLDCCFLFSRQQSLFFVETKMEQMNHRLTH